MSAIIQLNIMLQLSHCDSTGKRCRLPRGEADIDRAVIRLIERNRVVVTHLTARNWTIARPFIAG